MYRSRAARVKLAIVSDRDLLDRSVPKAGLPPSAWHHAAVSVAGGDTTIRLRPVSRYVVHAGCAPLLRRMTELMPGDTEYLVLDLDKTVHFEVTIGEQLGWELIAGGDTTRDDSPLTPYFTWQAPAASAWHLAVGLRRWGLPALLYAATVRLGDRYDAWERIVMARAGADYVDRVQTLLRHVLMANLAGSSREHIERCVDRAWRRWEHRLVVTRNVLDAVRRRCPKLRAVLLSSASTTPTVAQAAARLGADGYVASDIELYSKGDEEVYSAPAAVPRWLRRGRPEFFARPGAVFHNAAENKAALLRMRYPEVFAASAVSVGISDNNHNEDRSWPEHFAHAIALNSRHPFSPFVGTASPCRTIQIVDAAPLESGGHAGRYRWLGGLAKRDIAAPALLARFGIRELGELEALADELRVERGRAAVAVDVTTRGRVVGAVTRLGDAVNRYNTASNGEKPALARKLYALARDVRRLEARARAAGRGVTRLQQHMDRLHQAIATELAPR